MPEMGEISSSTQSDEMRGKFSYEVFFMSEFLRIAVGGRGNMSEFLRIAVGSRGKQTHFGVARIHSGVLNHDRYI